MFLGVPGAKIDKVFDRLRDSSIKNRSLPARTERSVYRWWYRAHDWESGRRNCHLRPRGLESRYRACHPRIRKVTPWLLWGVPIAVADRLKSLHQNDGFGARLPTGNQVLPRRLILPRLQQSCSPLRFVQPRLTVPARRL